jgi:hypothetical protein
LILPQNQRFLPIFDVSIKYNYLILKVFIYAPTPQRTAKGNQIRGLLAEYSH